MLALVARDTVAGVLSHPVPAHGSVAARFGHAFIEVLLAARACVARAAEAGGAGRAVLAGAPVLTRVCVTRAQRSLTGRSVIAGRALASKAEVSSRA